MGVANRNPLATSKQTYEAHERARSGKEKPFDQEVIVASSDKAYGDQVFYHEDMPKRQAPV